MPTMIPEFVTNPDPRLYKTGTYLVLDFETTNIEKGTALNSANSIILACWMLARDGKVLETGYKFGNEYEMQPLLEAIDKADFLVAQNVKFELQWLERCGYDIGSKLVYDTFLAEWVIGGNRWVHADLGMDSIAKRRKLKQKSRIINLLMKGGVSPADMPRSLLLKYCASDVRTTHDIMRLQLDDMEGTRLLPIVYTRCLTALPLAAIEGNGLFLDEVAVEEEYERVLREYVQVTDELDEMTGGMNMNSTPQKIEFIYDVLGFEELINPYTGKPDRTDAGNPKTDKVTLGKLKVTTPEQRKFKELKSKQGKLNAALTKTLDFFVGVCRERGGLFYGEVRQGTTRTHRLSSAGRRVKFEAFSKAKGAQFQNLPNQYKRLIRSRHEDWLTCEADGAQLEFRVGGHLGRDEQIAYDVRHKVDIHTCTMEAINAAVSSKDEQVNRRGAKPYTFRPMYGGSSGSPAVEAYCKFFADKYHQLHERQTAWSFVAADKGWIETEWGMRYYFPKVKVLRNGTIKGKQQVFNYPIQAFATAEIIPIALVFFWYRTRNADLILINTVHDSVICEVPPYEIELFQKAAVQSLTGDVYEYVHNLYGIDISVPLGVGMKFGSSWGVSAYSDDELEDMVGGLRDAGFTPQIDDGEIVVDVENPYYEVT